MTLVKVNDMVQMNPELNMADRIRDLYGIVISIDGDNVRVLWELTENVHRRSVASLGSLVVIPKK